MIGTRIIFYLVLLERFTVLVATFSQSLDSGPCYYEQRRDGRLVKLNGVKVGHYRYRHLDDDEKEYRVLTKSLKPTILEIANFLSDSECEYFKTLAKKNGLKESVTGLVEHAYDGEIEEALQQAESENYIVRLPEFVDHFQEWDRNKDSDITMDEIKDMLERSNGLFLSEKEIKEMEMFFVRKSIIELEKRFRKINYTFFDDGKLNDQEFDLLPINRLDAYLTFTQMKHPFHRTRYSEHTWLAEQKRNDSVLKKVYDRVIRLTQLPRKLIEESEHIQVVRYGIRGHYHAHYDSTPNVSDKSIVCCHQNHERLRECRLCRLLTILFYLNDVEKGGETAFIVADNNTADVQYLKSLTKPFNLSQRCHDSKLIVPAKQGTAIMWYNHDIDPRTHWLGDLDYRTIHGGCDVLAGEKWIANLWINAPTPQSADIDSIFKN